MKLQEALEKLDQLSDDQVIFAQKPWGPQSNAEVGNLDADLRVPPEIADGGLNYFLEASIAKEVLEVFGERQVTEEQRQALLIFYAEHDAYPQWIYKS